MTLMGLGVASAFSGLILIAKGGAEIFYPGTGFDPLFAALGGVSLLINAGVLFTAAAVLAGD